MPVYAVTGASGHLGRFAIEQLLARGAPRRRRGAQAGQGHPPSRAWRAGARGGPFTPETLGAALAGVNRLLLVSSSELGQLAAQHTNVITAADGRGLTHRVHEHA